ncbi:MAG: hypothetical protein ALAOOOJD_01204 [bacterium]|nr:hypothetical protein [bacterium]
MATAVKRAVGLLPIIALCMLSCTINDNPVDSDPTNDKVVFRIEGKYTNPATNAGALPIPQSEPKFEIEQATLPKEIKSITVQTARAAGHRIDLIFNDLRIFDWAGEKKINYEITDVSFEEKVEGKWVAFTEFSPTPVQKINHVGIVLVLDASNSLGNDFNEVKVDAKEFVNLIFQNTDDSAQLGVVGFSTSLNRLPIDIHNTDKDSVQRRINAFIDKELQQDEFTALYDGMLAGLDMLTDPLLKVDAKALVTFTDGRDNYSSRTTSADTVAAYLKKHQIPGFTIGYKGRGELDQEILQRLAQASQGVFRLAEDKAKLKAIFHEFAVSVTDVYTVTYWRNDQIIETNEPRLIRLNIGARKKI